MIDPYILNGLKLFRYNVWKKKKKNRTQNIRITSSWKTFNLKLFAAIQFAAKLFALDILFNFFFLYFFSIIFFYFSIELLHAIWPFNFVAPDVLGNCKSAPFIPKHLHRLVQQYVHQLWLQFIDILLLSYPANIIRHNHF